MKIIIYVLIYFFIYQNIAFIPRFYGSYYNLLAFLFFIFNAFNFLYYKKKIVKTNIIKLILSLLLIVLVYFVSLIINNESIFIVNPIRNMVLRVFLDLNYIYFIINLINKYKNKEVIFFKGFIYSTFIDVIFSLLRFNYGVINVFFMKIYPPSNKIIERFLIEKSRLMGLGGFFFGGGIILSISLILITYIITDSKKIIKKEKIFLYFIYIFNLFIGILISRTIIIGFSLSLLYFFMSKKNKLYNLCKIYLGIIFILLVGYILFGFLDVEKQEWIIDFVYKTGVRSLKAMLRMYIFPDNLKTFLIGDALWGDEHIGYYMSTDIGYLRMIFFNGIIGLFFNILFNWKLTSISDRKLKQLSNVLFLLYLILNLKGYVAYLSISLFIYIYSDINIENKELGS